MGAFGEDQAINVPGQQRADLQLFFFRAVAKVAQHSLVARGIGHRLDAAQYIGEHLVGQGGQQHANGATGGIRQNIGGFIGDVTQLIQRLGNPAL